MEFAPHLTIAAITKLFTVRFNISIPSAPPFKSRTWDYAKANKDEIRECLNNIIN